MCGKCISFEPFVILPEESFVRNFLATIFFFFQVMSLTEMSFFTQLGLATLSMTGKKSKSQRDQI